MRSWILFLVAFLIYVLMPRALQKMAPVPLAVVLEFESENESELTVNLNVYYQFHFQVRPTGVY